MTAAPCPNDPGRRRASCPCDTCVEYRSEAARWNSRLASDNLYLDRGTSADTALKHRRRKPRHT